MLKLHLNPEPRWLEIGGGLRVKVPPLDTAILRAVEYQAFQAYAAMKTQANAGDDTLLLDTIAVARLEGAFALARIRQDMVGVSVDASAALALVAAFGVEGRAAAFLITQAARGIATGMAKGCDATNSDERTAELSQ